MAIIQRLSLSAKSWKYPPTIPMVYGDTSRVLYIDGIDFDVNDFTAGLLNIARPDGTFYGITGTAIPAEHVFSFECDQICTQMGKTQCTLQLTDADGIVSTFYFYVRVVSNSSGTPVPQQGISLALLQSEILALQDRFPVIPADISDGAVITSKLLNGAVTTQKLADAVLDLMLISDSVANVAIASISDGANNVPVKGLICGIDPVQDLHGYDNPWPAGGGKNLLNFAEVIPSGSYSNNGATFSGDGISSRPIVAFSDSNIDVIYTQESITGTTTNPRLVFYDIEGNSVGTVTLGTNTSKSMSGVAKVQIDYGSQGSFSISKPMLRLSSVSDATFAPYSNICPISGWTGINVSRTGINIWDEQWELGGYSGSTGHVWNTTDRIRSKSTAPIKVKPNTSYYFYTHGKNGVVYFYAADDSFISCTTAEQNYSFTTPTNCFIVRFMMDAPYGTTYGNDISINYPSTDTSYHSGTENEVYTVFWQTEAGTVYGGTLDVTTGVLTVTKAMVTIGSLNWEWGNPGFYADISTKIRTVAPYSADYKLLCEEYNYQYDYGFATQNNRISDSTSYPMRVFIRDNRYISTTAFKTAEGDKHILYTLATPQTYQLSPTEVDTILGLNNVWADTGDVISLVYRADTKLYIDRVLSAVQNRALLSVNPEE